MPTQRFIHRFIPRFGPLRRWRMVVRPLCLVLLLASGMWLATSYATQWWLVGRLVHELHQANDVEAPRLVQELARREGRGYQALVHAANSPRAAVALSARREIDTRIDRWQRESYLSPTTFNLRTTALPMAKAFAKQAPDMGPSARRWSRRVVEELTLLAASQPLRQRLELLEVCDRALVNLPRDDPAALLADAGRASLPILLGSSQLDQNSITGETVPHPPLVSNSPATVVSNTPASQPEPSGGQVEPEDSQWQQVRPLPTLPAEEGLANAPHPFPSSTTHAVPAREVSLSHPTRFPAEAQQSAGPMAPARPGNHSFWFERLARGNEAEQTKAQEMLFTAGFGQVRRAEALMFLSASIDDRKALVDRALTSPRLETTTWLELLLTDPAPEVRAATVAAIATSGSEALLNRALEVALNDPAPAVADQLPLIRRQLR